MVKKFRYVFINKTCPFCIVDTVEDFWTEDLHCPTIRQSGCYCPNCHVLFYSHITSQSKVIERAKHILRSEEKVFIRKVSDAELIKKHGVSADWLYVGKKVYIDPEFLREQEVKEFMTTVEKTPSKVLVYLPNNYLERLYFFVPIDALK